MIKCFEFCIKASSSKRKVSIRFVFFCFHTHNNQNQPNHHEIPREYLKFNLLIILEIYISIFLEQNVPQKLQFKDRNIDF